MLKAKEIRLYREYRTKRLILEAWDKIEGPMREEFISRLIELEKDVQYQEFASETEPEYLYTTGKVPVLISTPHGAVHTRDGNHKEEDEYTAGFARLIGERTNGHILY